MARGNDAPGFGIVIATSKDPTRNNSIVIRNLAVNLLLFLLLPNSR